jgi:hypothetical protein
MTTNTDSAAVTVRMHYGERRYTFTDDDGGTFTVGVTYVGTLADPYTFATVAAHRVTVVGTDANGETLPPYYATHYGNRDDYTSGYRHDYAYVTADILGMLADYTHNPERYVYGVVKRAVDAAASPAAPEGVAGSAAEHAAATVRGLALAGRLALHVTYTARRVGVTNRETARRALRDAEAANRDGGAA